MRCCDARAVLSGVSATMTALTTSRDGRSVGRSVGRFLVARLVAGDTGLHCSSVFVSGAALVLRTRAPGRGGDGWTSRGHCRAADRPCRDAEATYRRPANRPTDRPPDLPCGRDNTPDRGEIRSSDPAADPAISARW